MSSEVLSKMSKETHSQDSNSNDNVEESLNAYKKAAEFDEYLFGDYDYCKEWIGISTSDS